MALPGIVWCCQALHSRMKWCHWAFPGATGHCTALLAIPWRQHWPFPDATGHSTVTLGIPQSSWATPGWEPGATRCCQGLHSTTSHGTAREQAMPGTSRLPCHAHIPVPHVPTSPGWRRRAAAAHCFGRRIPCPADGRYNKAACCGQANYLSNYDLPLNHMIFLQSCRQLKPG